MVSKLDLSYLCLATQKTRHRRRASPTLPLLSSWNKRRKHLYSSFTTLVISPSVGAQLILGFACVAMERKRKLPARAAARVEHEAKRRNSTPRERSEDHEPTPAEPRPPPLPRSVEAGKPLPTVEDPQDDLASKDFQSIGERYV